MPRKKEVAEKEVKSNDSVLLENMYEKVERIERLTIIVWSLSILTFMLVIFCLFK